jgi:hypothetical protein
MVKVVDTWFLLECALQEQQGATLELSDHHILLLTFCEKLSEIHLDLHRRLWNPISVIEFQSLSTPRMSLTETNIVQIVISSTRECSTASAFVTYRCALTAVIHATSLIKFWASSMSLTPQ